MVFEQDEKGIRKLQIIEFAWNIPNYDIGKRYTNKIKDNGLVIKTLLDPVFSDGKVTGSNPHIMIEKNDENEEIPKEIKFVIKTPNYRASFATFEYQKLKYHHKYSCRNIFIEKQKIYRIMENPKNLVLIFEIYIADCGYKIQAHFDDSQYMNDFKNLFECKDYSDCEIVVDNTVILANKFVILSRSPVLGQLIEDSGNKVVIEDHSIESVNEFLRYLYCEEIRDKKDDTIFQVLSLADIFKVECVKQYCEIILNRSLNMKNANKIFQKAHKFQLSDDLKRAAFALIQSLFKNINQKLADEFISDPVYVDNLITIAESLINGLKKREVAKANDGSVSANQSSNHLEIEKAIEEIYKEGEVLENDDNGIDDCAASEDVLESIQHIINTENNDITNAVNENNLDSTLNIADVIDDDINETKHNNTPNHEEEEPEFDDIEINDTYDKIQLSLETIAEKHMEHDDSDSETDDSANTVLEQQVDSIAKEEDANFEPFVDFKANLQFVIEFSQDTEPSEGCMKAVDEEDCDEKLKTNNTEVPIVDDQKPIPIDNKD